MPQRATNAPHNPPSRSSRWTLLWRPLLRLSLGFYLALSPFVFTACSTLEGVSHAQGVLPGPEFEREINALDAWRQRGGIRFEIENPPSLSAEQQSRYVSQKIFGLSPTQDALLRQKDPSFPKMHLALIPWRLPPELYINVDPAYYTHIILQEKLHLPLQPDLTAYISWYDTLPVWWQQAIEDATLQIGQDRGGQTLTYIDEHLHKKGFSIFPRELKLALLYEIIICQYKRTALSSPSEDRILREAMRTSQTTFQKSGTAGGAGTQKAATNPTDRGLLSGENSSRAAGSSQPHPHVVASDAERASYHLDGVATDPAYSASIKGPDQLVAGASAVYTMILDTPGRLPDDEVYYSFALYNVTPLIQKGLAGQVTKDALAHKDLAEGEDITLWAAKHRDLSRRLENLKTDTKTAAKGVIHPLTQGGPLREEIPAALINTGSLYLTEASALVSLGGFVAHSFVDWIAGAVHEREVPAPMTPGYYLLRSIGTPQPTGYERRASSVAVKIIEVRSAEYWAKEARDAEERALLELALTEKTTQDPQALAEVKQQEQDLRKDTQQPLEQLLTGQRAALQQQLLLVPPDATEKRNAVRDRLANVDVRLRLVRKYTPRFQDPTRLVRVKAGFASSETSLTVPLLLQLDRLPDAGGRPHYGLLDATVPDGDFYDATGATEEEALWNTFAYFAGHAGYGRGALAVTLPPSDKLPVLSSHSRVLDCHPTGTSLLKNRLHDLSIVLTLLSLPVSSVGGVALLLGGALSAVRLYERLEHDTLKWDFEAVTDTLMVLGAASSAVGALGKFVRVQVGGQFALATQGANVAQLTAVLQQVEAGTAGLGQVIGVGGLVVGNLGVLKQLKDIEAQELSGAITHTEARRQSADVLFQGLLTNALFVKGLQTKPKEATPGPVATLKELPPIGGHEPPPPDKLTSQQEAQLRKGPAGPSEPPGSPINPIPVSKKPIKKPGGTTQEPETVEAQELVAEEQVLAATGTDDAAQQSEAQGGKSKALTRGAGLTVMDAGKTGAGGTDTGSMGGSGTSGVNNMGTVVPSRGGLDTTGASEIAPGSQGPALEPESTATPVRNLEQSVAPSNDAFEIAQQGGKNSGFLKNYAGKSQREIRKGIKSLEKQILAHRNKIAHPEEYYPKWSTFDPRRQFDLLNKRWPADIQRQTEHLQILRRLLKGNP